MEFLFGFWIGLDWIGLDMLRKHLCIIDLKDNVLRVGRGEVAIPFCKDIPNRFLDEERQLKGASSSGPQGTSGSATPHGGQSSGAAGGNPTQGAEFEAKVGNLIELGFIRDAVLIQALMRTDGNEDQAAG